MMGYHSDTLAFKKSELLAVLQAIDESFSFDTVVSNEQKIQEAMPSSRQDFGDYKTLLFKKPLLSLWDAASIISDTNPVLLSDLNEYEAGREYPNWIGALSFVSSSISAGLLEQNDFSINCIKRDDLKAFLASQDIFVDGFNDNLPTQASKGFGHLATQQAEPNIENLNAEIARLTELVAEKDSEAFEEMLNKSAAESKAAELQERIKQLEAERPIAQDNKPDLLALILDDTQLDRYAPDLAYSIKLWLDVYVNNPKADSHNNKANTWIKNNTPYNGEQDDTPTRRIREIATPFRDLHQSRKKLLENK